MAYADTLLSPIVYSEIPLSEFVGDDALNSLSIADEIAIYYTAYSLFY